MESMMAQWHKLNRHKTSPYSIWLEDRAEEMQIDIARLKKKVKKLKRKATRTDPRK